MKTSKVVKTIKNLEEEKLRLEMELKLINDQMEDVCRAYVPRMLTMREASRETGLSYNHIRSLSKSGKIVSIQAGNRILINREKLIDYLNSGKEQSI